MGAHVRAVAKAKVNRVHRAMALRRLAATALKGAHALKVKAMVNVKAVVAKSSAAIPALTTARMAQAVRRHVARAQRAVAVAVKAVRAAVKTAIATTAMNCHATLTL